MINLKELIKQFPFIYPFAILDSKTYIDKQNSRTTFYNQNRGYNYTSLEKQQDVILKAPVALKKDYHKFFIKNTVYKTNEKYLFQLHNCYIYGNKGITLTRENFLLKDLTHQFNIQSLSNYIYKRPFLTFSLNIVPLKGVYASLLSPCYNNIYHFIFDVALRLRYYENVKNLIDFYLIPEDLDERYASALKQYFGIDNNQLFKIDSKKKYNIEHLYTSSLTGSEGRLISSDISYLEKALNITPYPKATKKLYLTRGNVSSRKINNESDLITLLNAHGFEIIDCGILSIEDQINTLKEAKIVIGVHGAALTNILAMPNHGKVIEIFSPDYFRTDCFYPIASLKNISYQYITGNKEANWGDISLNLDEFEEILKTLDETN